MPRKNFRKLRHDLIENVYPMGFFFQPCPECHNIDYIKIGRAPSQTGDHQRVKCRICDTRYDTNAIPGSNEPWVIEMILNSYIDGGHLEPIARNVRSVAKLHGEIVHISKSTVFNYIKYAHNQLKSIEKIFYHTVFSSDWEIDEIFQRYVNYGQKYCTNIVSVFTRFWLSGYVSASLNEDNALIAIAQAISRSGYDPLLFRCDGSNILKNAIKKAIPGVKLHSQSKDENIAIINTIETLHRIIRRMNIKKGKRFYSLDKLQIAVDLCRINYNFLKPHSFLGGLTPANAAGIKHPFKNWIDLLTFAHRLQYD